MSGASITVAMTYKNGETRETQMSVDADDLDVIAAKALPNRFALIKSALATRARREASEEVRARGGDACEASDAAATAARKAISRARRQTKRKVDEALIRLSAARQIGAELS